MGSDELIDALYKLFDAGKRVAGDRLIGNQRKEVLGQIEQGTVRLEEVLRLFQEGILSGLLGHWVMVHGYIDPWGSSPKCLALESDLPSPWLGALDKPTFIRLFPSLLPESNVGNICIL